MRAVEDVDSFLADRCCHRLRQRRVQGGDEWGRGRRGGAGEGGEEWQLGEFTAGLIPSRTPTTTGKEVAEGRPPSRLANAMEGGGSGGRLWGRVE